MKSIKKFSILRAGLLVAGFLMVPLLLQWPWGREDFIVMGVMIFVFGLILDLVLKRGGKYKVAVAFAVVFLFLWLWVELAVGLFTNWGS